MVSLGGSRVLSDGINRISGPFVAYGGRRSKFDDFDYGDCKITNSGREEEEDVEEENNYDFEREDGWTAAHYSVWSIAKEFGLCDENSGSDDRTRRVAEEIFSDVIVAKGFDVTAVNVSGVSVLHLASNYGLHKYATIALDAGCDVDARADDSFKNVCWKKTSTAAKGGGGGGGIKPVFPRECDLYRPDSFCIGSDVTPLYLAARAGHKDLVRLLVARGADLEAGKCFGGLSGITALQAAAARGHADVVEFLLERGSDPNAKANDGGTALLCAVEFGHSDVVDSLLRFRGGIERRRPVDLRAAKSCDELGELNSLHLAVLTKSETIMRQLIEAGVDVDQATSTGFTPLHLAAQNGCVELARMLIESGSDVNAKATSNDSTNLTALHLAIRSGSAELVNGLVDAGADRTAVLTVADITNVGPLHIAAVCGEAGIAKRLIQLGCRCDVETSAGTTALSLAVNEGHADVAEELLQQLVKNSSSKFPDLTKSPGYVHIAVMHKSKRLLQVLIAAGFDIDEVVEPAREAPMSSQLSLVRPSNTLTPLLLAVDRNDKETTKHLIELGCKVRKALPDGLTALHVAAFHGFNEIAELLLSRGALPNAVAEFVGLSRVTALHLAALYRRQSVVETLVAAGAKLDAVAIGPDIGQVTPLYLASVNGDPEAVRCLADAGCDVNWSRREDGRTALYEASASGSTDTVRNILNSRDFKALPGNQTVEAFLEAAVKGHTEIVELLATRGCGVNSVGGLNGDRGYTALHLATAAGNVRTVQKLLELGSDANAKHPVTEVTSLHLACQSDSVSIARLLLDAGANVNHAARIIEDRIKRCAPLHLAADKGYTNLTRLLLSSSADVNVTRDDDSRRRVSALHLAATNGHHATLRALIEGGADVEGTDSDGFAALHWASGRGHLDIVRTLTSKRSKAVAAAAATGVRARVLPIHLAAESGHAAVIRFLVAGGSPVEPESKTEDADGITPLHLAAAGDHARAVETLAGLGADIDRRDSQGYTALHKAVRNKTGIAALECLVRLGADLTVAAANSSQERGALPLHTAVLHENRAAVKLILKAGVCDINATMTLQEVDGVTALHLAAAKGSSEMIRTLVKGGSSKTLRTGNNKTALDIALEKGFKHLKKWLV